MNARDVSREVVRENLSRIKLISVAGPLLRIASQRERVERLLETRRRWGLDQPLLMVATHNDDELAAAERFRETTSHYASGFRLIKQKGHNETTGNAVGLYREEFDASADAFTAKRGTLRLTRRGGKGKPHFVSPFTGGAGTTCGEWTYPMVRKKDGTIVKGFMKADVAVGFCPVECPYCYLNMPYTDGMDVALNLEDLADELASKWSGYRHPINFGETSGLVEYDEWFADQDPSGSIIQFIIDACASANVTPFFLTKLRYPRYLTFNGTVQVGISLMPEPVRRWLAPNGSPAEELLEGLSWAASQGAVDPVIRLTVIWRQISEYRSLLQKCRDLLGGHHWRLTLDILRFTPVTASIIAGRYPEAADFFAEEIDPSGEKDFRSLAREANRGTKKIRPPVQRQAQVYRWFRETLDELGCSQVMLTPCKGDPKELLGLARDKTISAMPCACYGSSQQSRTRGSLE